MTSLKDLFDECYRLHVVRNKNYGESIFRDASKILTRILKKHITPIDVVATMVVLKLLRYFNLLSYKKDTTDTTIDIINYVALMDEERKVELNEAQNTERKISITKGTD